MPACGTALLDDYLPLAAAPPAWDGQERDIAQALRQVALAPPRPVRRPPGARQALHGADRGITRRAGALETCADGPPPTSAQLGLLAAADAHQYAITCGGFPGLPSSAELIAVIRDRRPATLDAYAPAIAAAADVAPRPASSPPLSPTNPAPRGKRVPQTPSPPDQPRRKIHAIYPT